MVRCRSKVARAFSLLEMMIVLGMMSLVFVVVSEPLSTILSYPNRTSAQRTDRFAGQRSYNLLRSDLRNALQDKVWVQNFEDGVSLLFMVGVNRFDTADSEARATYTLWKYDGPAKTLARLGWDKAQLETAGLPVIQEEPTSLEWDSYKAQDLLTKAEFVNEFSVLRAPDLGTQVEFAIRQPTRTGPGDRYLLELER